MKKKINILNVYDKNGLSGVKSVIEGIQTISDSHLNVYTLCLRNLEGNDVKETEKDFIYKSKNKFSLFSFLRFVKIIREKEIHLIHSHQGKSLLFSMFYKCLFNNKIVIIQHEHGEIFQNKYLYMLLMKFASRRLALIITVSNAVKNELLSALKISDKNITILYNFVDHKKFSRNSITWDVEKEKERLGIKEGNFVVGFAGRLIKRKGWEEFVLAANKIVKSGNEEISFVIAGDGEDREKMLTMIKELGLFQYIKYLAYVSDMVWFYSIIDCFVMPSHLEGMGLTQIEAQSMGVPVIASDVPVLKESINDYENGLLFKVKEENDLAEKIRILYKQKELRSALSRNGLKSAKKYNLQTYTQRLNKIYKNYGKW